VLKPGGEGEFYDGCVDAVDARAAELKAAVGPLRFWLYRHVARIHGLTAEQYRARIAPALAAAGFGGDYTLELHDIWMKVAFHKPG
jgi:hypothetical protein